MKTRKRVVVGVGIFAGLMFAYALSAWPLVYFTSRFMQPYQDTWWGNAYFATFDVLYRPHDWVMYHSKWYFDYLMNASILGEPRFLPPTWEAYRQAVDESGNK